MLDYYDALISAGVMTEVEIDDDAGHAWIDAAPERVVAWFEGQL